MRARGQSVSIHVFTLSDKCCSIPLCSAREEPEEFKRDKYVRDDEPARAWALSSLTLPPDFAASGGAAGTSTGTTGTAQGFFPASRFASHRSHLDKRGPLHWPNYCQLSSDHTHPRWRFSSHHRLKNVIVVMEYTPDADVSSASGGAGGVGSGAAALAVAALTDGQRQRLNRVFQMYDVEGRQALSEQRLRMVMATRRMGSTLQSSTSGLATRARSTHRRTAPGFLHSFAAT